MLKSPCAFLLPPLAICCPIFCGVIPPRPPLPDAGAPRPLTAPLDPLTAAPAPLGPPGGMAPPRPRIG